MDSKEVMMGFKEFYQQTLTENKYKVQCQKTGKTYTYTTTANKDVGDFVTMYDNGKKRRRKVIEVIQEQEDLSRLPKDIMSDIRKNIREGAEDLTLDWANALELVHKAYEVVGVERPKPSMKTGWQQYEENIEYAVAQLASNRGMEADWRMSSSTFHQR